MLADNDRAAFTGLEVLWQEQVSPGIDIGQHIQHHLVTGPFGTLDEPARARVERETGGREATDNILPKGLSEGSQRGFPVVRRSGFDLVPEEGLSHFLGVAIEPLSVRLELDDLPVLARGRIIRRASIQGRRAGQRQLLDGQAQALQQCDQRAVGAGPGGHAFGSADEFEVGELLRIAGLEQLLGPSEFQFDVFVIGCGDPARGGASAAALRCRWAVHRGRRAVLDDEGAGGDQGGDFSIAKFLEQAEYVAVDGFLPDTLPGGKVSADEDGLDPCVERRRVEGKQTTFTVAREADLRGRSTGRRGFGLEEIYGGQDLLDFVADDVAAHFEGLPVNPFAMRLVGEAPDPGVAGPRIIPVDQNRYQDLAAVLSQSAGKLSLGQQTRRETGHHFRRFVGIREDDDAGARAAFGTEPEPFRVHVVKNRPANRLDGEGFGCSDLRRVVVSATNRRASTGRRGSTAPMICRSRSRLVCTEAS